MGAALATVGLAVLMVVMVEAGPAGATFPGKNGKIAYSANDGQDSEIFTINSGGRGKLQVTDNATSDFNPSYSPDGTKIAYDGPAGDSEICTINSNGGGKVQLTDNNTYDNSPSWGSK